MSKEICVTICTRERPKMLARCLSSVLPQLQASSLSASLVVVENGDQPSCRHTVLRMRERFPSVRIQYELEPELGIPFARNKAVETALSLKADWIVFIDDDEEAQADWFEKLTAAIEEWNADVFHGPVKLIYPENHPEWMRAKSFDGGARGAILETASTNNTLARARLFSDEGLGLRFDTHLRFTGGSDVELFRRAVKAGAVIRWVDDAFVTEHVSDQRLAAKWLLGRTCREAANASNLLIKEYGYRTALRVSAVRCGRLGLEAVIHATLTGLTVARPEIASRHLFRTRNKISKLTETLALLSGLSVVS
ncbi:MAG: glycosyltransferase [Alphaproteobacteria bacterium]